MSNPQDTIIEALAPFAPHFSRHRTWEKARLLVIGTLLTNGRRVVTAALRTLGLQNTASFNQYHHVLSRAVWSPLAVAQTLLRLLLETFCSADEPLLFGIDESIERRWGHKIAARGIYRDAVQPVCESEWLALDQRDAVDADFLGGAGMGLTRVNGFSAFRTLL